MALCLCTGLLATSAAATPLDEPILPLPVEHGQDPAKVALGQRLFFDTRLSSDNSMACVDCHDLGHNGGDRVARSVGVQGRIGDIRSLTVYNARFNLAQFWDGRAVSLEEQVNGPLTSHVEMASTWSQVLARLRDDPGYVKSFRMLYADGLTAVNVRDAIATFERSLVTVDAPFDRWLRGQADAISARQERGYTLFKSYGCIACHNGANVGGNSYQYFGTLRDFLEDEPAVADADLGRFRVTGNLQDRYLFKVPSLRLAVRNAPYFHNGSVKTLEKAIVLMGRYQLGREIPQQDVEAIADFLASLLGQHPLLAP